MSLSRRLRNIAKTQINALKERLDRVDENEDTAEFEKREAARAERELLDPTDIRLARRSPEEIATGRPSTRAGGQSGTASQSAAGPAPGAQPTNAAASPLTVHYRILGIEDGTDLSGIQAAYEKLAARCDPTRFPEGTPDRETAEAIKQRVDSAFDALRDALDPTAGRFDKLEL